MPTRRPLLKRVTLWTAGVVLLLASYVGGAPFVCYTAERVFPASEPFFVAVYSPLIYIATDSNAPGHAAYMDYLEWAESVWRHTFE